MLQYFIWTIGCQMNKAESDRIAAYLEHLGCRKTPVLDEANLIIANTCVVRQQAENKVLGNLGYLKGLKKAKPHLRVLVTGCFVNSEIHELEKSFPFVNLFFKPGDYASLLDWAKQEDIADRQLRVEIPLPPNPSPSVFVPIIQGCNNFCSYCIVPYRRGQEKSRPFEEIVCEVKRLVKQGIKEVTLLGQNVNSYGHDLPQQPDLADLLIELNEIDGLSRIRFLTNHPKDMKQRLIEVISSCEKVCEHLSLPLQSGDDEILNAMRRDYTAKQYRRLIQEIRHLIPQVALSTDIIVGFPGESQEQFQRTVEIIEEVKFDTVHVAPYSPRPSTVAAKNFRDDIPASEKKKRLEEIEKLQEGIATEINSRLLDKTVEVLVEGRKKGKWYGRTRSNKLVFFSDEADCFGKLVMVRIEKTSPWALQGRMN